MAKTQHKQKSEVRLQRIRDERDEHARLKTKYNVRIAACVVILFAVLALTWILDINGIIGDSFAWVIGLAIVVEIPVVVVAFFANNSARKERAIIDQIDRELYKQTARINKQK